METASFAFRDVPAPGMLSTSGLTMVDESLVRGRFVPRCWSSTGFLPRGIWPVHGGVPFQHTPQLDGRAEPRGWCVIEYASRDRSRGMAGIFRLAGDAPETWRFKARGLDRGSRYRVSWGSTGQAAEIDGLRLAEEGLEIRRSLPMTSELLLFQRA